jgi:hypothetical protein
VLGAFLVGVTSRRVGTRAMAVGMVAGLAAVTIVWWSGVAAWTWYSTIGAATTCLIAWSGTTLNRLSHV